MSELTDKVFAVQSDVEALKVAIPAIVTQVADLKAQVAAGADVATVLPQLDAIHADLTVLTAQLS